MQEKKSFASMPRERWKIKSKWVNYIQFKFQNKSKTIFIRLLFSCRLYITMNLLVYRQSAIQKLRKKAKSWSERERERDDGTWEFFFFFYLFTLPVPFLFIRCSLAWSFKLLILFILKLLYYFHSTSAPTDAHRFAVFSVTFLPCPTLSLLLAFFPVVQPRQNLFYAHQHKLLHLLTFRESFCSFTIFTVG